MKSNGDISNQWLPGVGGGQSNLGVAPDMTTIAGTQFAVVVPGVAGDLDDDGDVDFVDLGFFVGVLVGTNLDAQHIARSDLDQDGSPNGDDILLFVGAMLP